MNCVRSLRAAFAATGVVVLTATSALAADAARGKELYDTTGCWSCHGYVGQGAGATGPKLAPNPLPAEAIRAYIRAPALQMPPYREAVLSDEDIDNIHAYLASIPAAPDVEDTILAE